MNKREFSKLPAAYQAIFMSTSILPKDLIELTAESAPPNKTTIVNMEDFHTFGVREYVKDNDAEYLIVSNSRGSKVVFTSEFRFWKVVVH